MESFQEKRTILGAYIAREGFRNKTGIFCLEAINAELVKNKGTFKVWRSPCESLKKESYCVLHFYIFAV